MATYDLTSSIPSMNSIIAGDILNCPYSGASVNIQLPPGTYTLQCWGAKGGEGYSTGGYGGYSTGVLSLSTSVYLILYTGGAGSRGSGTAYVSGGFNGGGQAYSSGTGSNTRKGSGGGASDIRINDDSLYARVIVAGGGAGGGASAGATVSYGGGLVAGSGSYGGTQTAGGTTTTTNCNAGSFGEGGSVTGTTQASGGGGGWYGGAATNASYGGGGSGYVYTSSTANSYPTGCLLSNAYYLGSASTSSGNTSFPAISGENETGHNSDGYIRITVQSVFTKINKPTLTTSVRTYNASEQSPVESGYNSSQINRTGTYAATMPGTYSITYTPKPGYMWSDCTTLSEVLTWRIDSTWKRAQSWIYDSSFIEE